MAIYNKDGHEIQTVYNTDGLMLEQCYDKAGAELIESSVTVNQDTSTGTASGYVLSAEKSGMDYVLRTVNNFEPYQVVQYFGYNRDNGNFYKFDGTTTVDVFNAEMDKIGSITLPSPPGHTNDGCYYGGKFYLPSGYFGVQVANATKIYAWDIASNTIETISVSGISQPSNGSLRMIAAICETERNSGKLYLVCTDSTSSELVHANGDKLSVYEHIIASGATTLMAELPWDCVYAQGATALDGILYVVCNTQTTGQASNYKGITLKVIRTDLWKHIDTLTCGGLFEPEGMDCVPIGNGWELETSLNNYGQMAKVARFTPPYSLVGEM